METKVFIALIAVACLAIGGIAGYALSGGDSDDEIAERLQFYADGLNEHGGTIGTSAEKLKVKPGTVRVEGNELVFMFNWYEYHVLYQGIAYVEFDMS